MCGSNHEIDRRYLGVVLFPLAVRRMDAWRCKCADQSSRNPGGPYTSSTTTTIVHSMHSGRILKTWRKQGINVIILEVDYNFAFKSHPELRRGTNPITRDGARRFAALCRKFNIRLIPEFQSLGHQSWKAETFSLLSVYPAFDLTPGAFPNNEGIYCREWDPLNPEVWRVVFQLMDEIIDAFRADAFHVGSWMRSSCWARNSRHRRKAKTAGVLFAKAVNEIYAHLVRKRHVEMLMWGDRLIDGKKYDFGEWEASTNGTAAAIDLIPKDIIVCPWHYELRDDYPSIPMFMEKGFRVLPAGWKDLEATKALIEFSRLHADPKLLGHMFTTWGVKKEVRSLIFHRWSKGRTSRSLYEFRIADFGFRIENDGGVGPMD